MNSAFGVNETIALRKLNNDDLQENSLASFHCISLKDNSLGGGHVRASTLLDHVDIREDLDDMSHGDCSSYR